MLWFGMLLWALDAALGCYYLGRFARSRRRGAPLDADFEHRIGLVGVGLLLAAFICIAIGHLA